MSEAPDLKALQQQRMEQRKAQEADKDRALKQARPCPFCGLTYLLLLEHYAAPGAYWGVVCANCDAVGPSALNGNTMADAVEAWNGRGSGP